jgi:hypothetical protein
MGSESKSTEEISLKQRDQLEKIISFDELSQYLESVISNIDHGKLNLVDIDFLSIYQVFQKIVNQSNLEQGIHEFQKTTDIFKDKINLIQDYINKAKSDIGCNVFIEKQKGNENLFQQLLYTCFKTPVVLSYYPNEYLYQEFDRWVSSSMQHRRKEFIDPERSIEKGDFTLACQEQSFGQSLDCFFDLIALKLPLKLTDLLKQAEDSDQLYNWFIYCLHLIQKHRLIYDKDSKILSVLDDSQGRGTSNE